MKKYITQFICFICVLVGISLWINTQIIIEQDKRMNNLENKLNYIIWEKEYIDYSINDSLKQ